MSLPTDFQFSQASLQDYVDCPRRFQLRYVRRLAWPALRAEPALESEHYLRQGTAFHRLVHQHMVGLPTERLSSTVSDENLRRWWRNYLESPPLDLHRTQDAPSEWRCSLRRYPEVVLSAPVGGYRLVAKYDLVALDAVRRAAAQVDVADVADIERASVRASRVIIVDWKTSRKRPRRGWLAGRLQTRVYSYLLVQAGAQLNAGQPLAPEQVEMIYWFANFPADAERFSYDAAQYEADEVYLASLVEEIVGLGDGDFPLTDQDRHCRYCLYRSLCRRGVEAGSLDELEVDVGHASDELGLGDDIDLALDLEQIAEIEY
jgi:CRISPR/Cas system-associated exonuclease Cas4 (RecB family)